MNSKLLFRMKTRNLLSKVTYIVSVYHLISWIQNQKHINDYNNVCKDGHEGDNEIQGGCR